MSVEVENWNDLDAIRNDLTEDYVLVNDIDQNSAGYDTHASETANGGAGWDPIGGTETSSSGTEFTGTLDFGGFKVADLFIDRTTLEDGESAGLFWRVGGSAILENGELNIKSITGWASVGALAGRLIDNAQAKDIVVSGGDVTVTRDAFASTGGICGNLLDSAGIERCFSSCNIVYIGGSTGDLSLGGLLGRLQDRATIKDSGAEGDVDSDTGSMFGGLVGLVQSVGGGVNDGSIENCYARGSVNGNGAVGGLIGELRFADSGANFTLKKSYSTGSVSGNTDVGGFIGLITSGSGYDILDSFWDTETSSQANSAGDETGKTTAEMKDRDTFTDTGTTGLTEAWDMAAVDTYDETKTWGIGDLGTTTINDGYPFLMTFQEEPAATPDKLSASLTLKAPTVSGGATHQADKLSLSAVLKEVTVSAIQNATATPDKLSLAATIKDPTIFTPDTTVIPDTLTTDLTIKDPTITAVQNVATTPDTLSLTTTIKDPTVLLPIVARPDTLNLTTTIKDPIIQTIRNVIAGPDALSLSLTLKEATQRSITTVFPDTLSMSLELKDPSISVIQNATVTPETAELLLSLKEPAYVGAVWRRIPRVVDGDDWNIIARKE